MAQGTTIGLKANASGTAQGAPTQAPVTNLPAVLPPPKRRPEMQGWARRGLLAVILLAAAAAGGYWWLRPPAGLPVAIASGNGRIEADEIDIDTKFAGRIVRLFADEGDLTRAGEVLVKMDTQDLEASLKQSQSLVLQAGQTIKAAEGTMAQQQTQVVFARQEIARTLDLVTRGYATRQTLDQQQQALNSAIAGQSAAEAVIAEARHALDAATHATEVYQVDITDDALLAPRDGRIEYRVANVGEVLPAGGKIFTMLDTAYVYMDIYLPTIAAGRVKLGSDARIVLDSYPAHPFHAKVVYVAAQAQFTPKTVETIDERDVLMFRVRVRIDPERLLAHAAAVRSGLPGVAYVQTAAGVVWPSALEGSPAK